MFLSFLKATLSLLIFFLVIYFVGISRIFSSLILASILGVWFLATLVYGTYEWLVWYLDLYILSSKRIIDIEQKTLFLRQVSETSLDKIQDVTFEINGFLATLFNYGNVRIETAGKETIITLEQIKNPESIQKKIFNTQDQYQGEKE